MTSRAILATPYTLIVYIYLGKHVGTFYCVGVYLNSPISLNLLIAELAASSELSALLQVHVSPF